MDLIEGIEKRKSIRAFKNDPVPRDVLEKILNSAVAAPSKGNSQIWEFVVVRGEKLDKMKSMLHELLQTDFIPMMKLSEEEEVESAALDRAKMKSDQNKEEMSKVLKPMGIEFDDLMLGGTFTFFNAPVAILVFIDNIFMKNLPHLLSVGACVQNALLTAQTFELGTCWIGGVWRYTPQIRELLGIPKTKMLVSSIAIGYPDQDSPINKYKSGRDDLKSFIKWTGFDEDPGDIKE